MKAYLDLLREVRLHGIRRSDRTGTGTLSVFARQLRFDLSHSFPAVTTKRLYWRTMAAELLWMLRGETNIAPLLQRNVHIWDEWADPSGDLGPVYGCQWRSWPTPSGQTIDQIARLIEGIRRNPESRRHIVSAWNVGDLHHMALQPCHVMFQAYVAHQRLSLFVYQRSADLFIGLPFNIASYALLTCMIAQVCELQRGELVHTLGDVHLYLNHLDQTDTLLTRRPLPPPTLLLNPARRHIDSFTEDDITLLEYRHHPAISADIAV